MDYKEKYEQALERAKAIYQGNYKPDIAVTIAETLQNVFPELCESEDEKIRKMLIEFFGKGAEYNSSTNGIFDKDILSWLEKQGEPTEINPSEFDLRLNKLLKQFESLPKEELITNLSYYLNVIQNDGTYKIEKQGEQKSFDYENVNIQQKDFVSKEVIPRYSIGDVLCDKSCTTLGKEEQPNIEITDIRNGMYICDKCSFPISQQDEYELVAKRIEQKPWSEEDERLCQCLIKDQKEALDEVRNDKYGHSEIISDLKEMYHERIDWLESLKGRVQPKQEWSEEDESLRLRTIGALETCKIGSPTKCVDEQINWLKSLKQRIGG